MTKFSAGSWLPGRGSRTTARAACSPAELTGIVAEIWSARPGSLGIRDMTNGRTGRSRPSDARRLDDVAGAADGVDELRLDGVDLLAEVADVQLDDVRLALEVVLPHPVQDLRLGEHHPLVAHKVAKQLELGGGQVHLDTAAGDLVAVLVQLQVGDPQHALAALVRRGAAQHRVHPGQQLLDAERLDDVVVGAGPQPTDTVAGGVAGGQEDDGYLRPGSTQVLQYAQPVH